MSFSDSNTISNLESIANDIFRIVKVLRKKKATVVQLRLIPGGASEKEYCDCCKKERRKVR